MTETDWIDPQFQKDFGAPLPPRPAGYYVKEVVRGAREETGISTSTLTFYVTSRPWRPKNRGLRTTAKVLARSLDEYLRGKIRERDLLQDARPWANYHSDYRPLVEFAKQEGAVLKRRQELPPEAFWTAAELRAIVEAARRHFGDDREAARAALGHLFNALSYRWLAKGQPDPDGFHLERVANFLYSYLGRGNPKDEDFEKSKSYYLRTTPLNEFLFKPLGLSSPDCAIFWDFAVLWQKALPDEKGEQEDDRTDKQRAQFGEGLGASNVWYGHAHALTWVQRDLPDGFVGTTYDGSGWCFVEASLSAALSSSTPGAARVDEPM